MAHFLQFKVYAISPTYGLYRLQARTIALGQIMSRIRVVGPAPIKQTKSQRFELLDLHDGRSASILADLKESFALQSFCHARSMWGKLLILNLRYERSSKRSASRNIRRGFGNEVVSPF
jgi:hypothetical protein